MFIASRSVMKEFRALWVPWVACLAVMAACQLAGGEWSRLVIPVYFLGAVALGALSMGHEYSHRTITLLLSQPVRRAGLFAQKLGVLSGLLLILFIAAGLVMSYAMGRPVTAQPSMRTAALVLPALCGLLVAPWLTMLCRSALAGTVFSLAIPGLVFTIGEVLAATNYSSHSKAEHFSMSALWGGTLGLCAIGGVMGWRTFIRLEATEGRGSELRMPQWLQRSRPVSASSELSRHHPVWLLVTKELHLQQMALAISGLYLAGWAGVASIRYLVPDLELDFFNVLSVFYSGLIALLIGALACAEERQMGTLECQVLLPMATWKQWSVKVAVVVGLSMMLALGLPQLLTGGRSLLPSDLHYAFAFPLMSATPIVLLTIGGLYVSSLCTSGLWALLMSLPAVLGTVVFAGLLAVPLERWLFGLASPAKIVGVGPEVIGPSTIVVLAVMLMAGLVALVLRFSLANYRSVDRDPGGVGRQVSCIAAAVAIAQVILTGAIALHMARFVSGRL